LFQSTSIIHEATTPYISQQNGIAERKKQNLTKMTNAILSNFNLSGNFLDETRLTACYILNRVSINEILLPHMNYEIRENKP